MCVCVCVCVCVYIWIFVWWHQITMKNVVKESCKNWYKEGIWFNNHKHFRKRKMSRNLMIYLAVDFAHFYS
jgi:hypothetical protein